MLYTCNLCNIVRQLCMCAKSLQWRLTLGDPMNCSPPGSSVHGIFQARIPEWVAMPFSRRSSQPRNRTSISLSPALAGRFFTSRATWEAHTVAILHFFKKLEKKKALLSHLMLRETWGVTNLSLILQMKFWDS